MLGTTQPEKISSGPSIQLLDIFAVAVVQIPAQNHNYGHRKCDHPEEPKFPRHAKPWTSSIIPKTEELATKNSLRKLHVSAYLHTRHHLTWKILTAVVDSGRKKRVRAATVFIESLSCFITRLSRWVTRLNAYGKRLTTSFFGYAASFHSLTRLMTFCILLSRPAKRNLID